MTDIKSKDVSDPLKHLFSLDFGQEDVSEDGDLFQGSKNRPRKVRFANPQTQEATGSNDPMCSNFPLKQLKGILKNKPAFEESDLALTSLTTNELLQEDYSEDFSSSVDDVSEDDTDHDTDQINNDLITLEREAENVVDVEISRNQEETHSSDLSVSNGDENSDADVHDVNEDVGLPTEDKPDVVNDEASDINASSNAMNSSTTLNKSQKNSLNLSKQKDPKLKYNFQPQNMRRRHVKAWSSLVKPKSHFCIFSHLNDETHSHEQKNKSARIHSRLKHEKILLSRNKALVDLNTDKFKSSDLDWLPHQTIKLRDFLSKDSQNILSAKELRLCVFNAWCKIKSEERLENVEKSDLKDSYENISNKKSPNKEESSEAFIRWKLKKEGLKKKKSAEQTPKESSSESDQAKKDDLVEIVYNSWKQKKEKQLKEQRDKELQKVKTERINALKAKEVQKLEAASAFNAWKEVKQKVIDEQKQLTFVKAEAVRQKTEEQEERSKESEEAYTFWLQQKVNRQRTENSRLSNKPPWNPPG